MEIKEMTEKGFRKYPNWTLYNLISKNIEVSREDYEDFEIWFEWHARKWELRGYYDIETEKYRMYCVTKKKYNYISE